HEQNITITASSNMSEEDIKKAVNDAERYAEEDKKRKEEVETLNQADNLIYQTEKTMKEMDAKLDPADKATLENELADFKKVREGNDSAAIKSAMDAFTQKTYQIFGKVYQQQGGANPGAGSTEQPGGGVNDDGTVDSTFTDN
ncbi:MAG: Hsp70 family protein, partial [Clostridia bacterium]|nr:Hsp70 family protein [Clostridia bacterium]